MAFLGNKLHGVHFSLAVYLRVTSPNARAAPDGGSPPGPSAQSTDSFYRAVDFLA